MSCWALGCAAYSTPFLWSCPKKRGGAPKKNAYGWWRPREVSGPARLSHSRGSCHSAAKVSASRTDLITRPRGEGFGLDVDWRLKVFCPAFLQKSGRGPGAEPMAARRSARNSPCAKEAQEGVKGGTLAGGSPFAGGPRRPQPVRRHNARSNPTPGGGGTPPLRGVGGTWRGGRRTNVRVVEDADPYGSRQGRAACRGIYRVRVAAGEMVKMPPPAAFWSYLRDAEPYGAGAWRWLARYTKRKQRNTTSPSRTCVSRRSQRGEENKKCRPTGDYW